MKEKPTSILLVEDEEAHIDLIHSTFHSHAKQVRLAIARSIREARSYLVDSNPDLIICDWLLPDGKGTDLLDGHSESPPFPIVILTGQGDELVAVRAMKAGALDYVVKTEGTMMHMHHIAEMALREWDLINERKRLEARFHYSQKLESLGILAGGIAHEFNNLLMAIVANAGLALKSLPPQSPEFQYLQKIEGAGMRGRDLANQMLIYAGRGQPVIQALHLSTLVQEMDNLLRTTISKNSVLIYDLAADLPEIEGDPSRLQQIVMNVVTNASEAIGGQRGTITLKTQTMEIDRDYLHDCYFASDLPEGRCVYLEVVDSGSGMDTETLKQIFDPFFTTKFPGRGLGLAAVLGNIRGHRGAIKVSSQVGTGTTIRILFSCAKDKIYLGINQSRGDKANHAARTILLVEDEEEVRLAVQLILEQMGHQVLTASDGQAAFQVFREHEREIDVVLLDLTLPGLNGTQLFLKIRERNPEVCVILSSGYTEEEALKSFEGKGLNGFLQKPYQIEMLKEKLQEVFHKSDSPRLQH